MGIPQNWVKGLIHISDWQLGGFEELFGKQSTGLEHLHTNLKSNFEKLVHIIKPLGKELRGKQSTGGLVHLHTNLKVKNWVPRD